MSPVSPSLCPDLRNLNLFCVTAFSPVSLITFLNYQSRQTYEVCDADGVQVGGVSRVLQVGQRRAERVVNALPAVVVPLHVQQVGDHVNGCGDTERRLVTLLLSASHVLDLKMFEAAKRFHLIFVERKKTTFS